MARGKLRVNRTEIRSTLMRVVALAAAAGFLLYAYLVLRVGWTMASQPADDVATSVAQGELLAATINLILGPILLGATAVTALATWKTVGEMRDGRHQERQLELERRDAAAKAAIRQDAWILIGNVYAVAAVAGAVGAATRSASRFGRVRPSIEQPLIQVSFGNSDRITEATVAALRLQDASGPWAAPARELSQLLLDIFDAVPDPERAVALAAQVTEPVQRLRESLPR